MLPLTPGLPQQLARNFTKSLLGFHCRCGLPCFREFSLAARHDQNLRQPSRVENQGVFCCSCIRKEGSASWTMLSIRCFPSADAVAYATRTAGRISGLRARMICKSISCLRHDIRSLPLHLRKTSLARMPARRIDWYPAQRLEQARSAPKFSF